MTGTLATSPWLDTVVGFLQAHDPTVRKVLLGMCGGFGGYLRKVNFFDKLDAKTIKWGIALLYSFVGMVGGICILNPADPLNAFAAGLIGVVTIKNFISQHDQKVTSPSYDVVNKKLSPDEIQTLFLQKSAGH